MKASHGGAEMQGKGARARAGTLGPDTGPKTLARVSVRVHVGRTAGIGTNDEKCASEWVCDAARRLQTVTHSADTAHK